MQAVTLISAEEFDLLAETDERRLEFLDGETIEVGTPRPILSDIVCNLFRLLDRFASNSRLAVTLYGKEFRIGHAYRFILDLAFPNSSKEGRLDLRKTPIDILTDLAVEVISPSENAYDVERKIASYLEAGVTEVWTIYSNIQRIHIDSASQSRAVSTHRNALVRSFSLMTRTRRRRFCHRHLTFRLQLPTSIKLRQLTRLVRLKWLSNVPK